MVGCVIVELNQLVSFKLPIKKNTRKNDTVNLDSKNPLHNFSLISYIHEKFIPLAKQPRPISM